MLLVQCGGVKRADCSPANSSLKSPRWTRGVSTAALSNPPDSLRVTARLDHGEGLRSAPVPEVELVVGGDEEQLSRRVESQ